MPALRYIAAAAALLALNACSDPGTPADESYDLLIAGGRVFDECGASARVANIGISGNRIVSKAGLPMW